MNEKHWMARILTVIILASMIFSAFGIGSASAAPLPPKAEVEQVDPEQVVRYIVQLQDAPLATYRGEIQGLAGTSIESTGRAKLDTASPFAEAYVAYLTRKQDAFRSAVTAAIPDARFDRSFHVVLNGVTVVTQAKNMDALTKIHGVVSVAKEQEYTIEMDASLPLIGLGSGTVGDDGWVDEGLWAAVGGHEVAGEGIKIADIDSGITFSNPCFDPTGYTMPAGFPRGNYDYESLVNGKIIASYAFYRPDWLDELYGYQPLQPKSVKDDPDYSLMPDGTWSYVTGGGHGTHTAGTMACNYGTTTQMGGTVISGVAPKAQLMTYRVFYHVARCSWDGTDWVDCVDSASAWTPELIAAIEQAVIDGADVVNNSWGGTSLNAISDPEVAAYEAAVAAGVVVVFSAGNSGPKEMTIGNPGGNSDQFITVGASDTGRSMYSVTLAEPTPWDPELDGIPALPGSATPFTSDISGQMAYYDEGDAWPAAPSVAELCGPFPTESFSGNIAVIRRGNCTFTEKIAAAKTAGAIGVIIANNQAGTISMATSDPTMPSVSILQVDGDKLIAWVIASMAGATQPSGILNVGPFFTDELVDTLAAFSSRGPTPDYRIKPDLVAPGVNILSSVSPSDVDDTDTTDDFALYQGTSMAAPHVTGAAALVKQLYPGIMPWQVKSLLTTTTEDTEYLGDNPTFRGSGRLDLTDLENVTAFLTQTNLSYGIMYPGETKTLPIDLFGTNGGDFFYPSTTPYDPSGYNIVSGPTYVYLPGSAHKTINFTVVAPDEPGDYYGMVYLEAVDGEDLHFPYWVRVVQGYAAADVILIDDDGSNGAGCPDYSTYYMDALDDLDKSYVHYEVDQDSGFIDFNLVAKYPYSIYFTGYCGGALSYNAYYYPNALRNYLAQGGRMLITGQDIGYWDEFFKYNYVSTMTFNPELYFGGAFLTDDILYDYVDVPAFIGSPYTPFTVGQGLDVSYYGDLDFIPPWVGAMNQEWVDGIEPMFWSDLDAVPFYEVSDIPADEAGVAAGVRESSEPNIYRMFTPWDQTQVPWRTVWLGFGLEGVNNNPAFTSQTELLDSILSWMDDDISVTLDKPVYVVEDPRLPINAVAEVAADYMDEPTATGITNAIDYITWGWGTDETNYETEESGSTFGLYLSEAGNYRFMVEVGDTFGHKAVAESLAVYPDYLPYEGQILKDRRPFIDWPDTPGAVYYQLQTAKTPSFKTLTSNKVLSASKGSWHIPTTLQSQGTAYYWRIRAYVGGRWQAWSTPINYITANPPSAPVKLSPANATRVKNYTPVLDWKNSSVPLGTTFAYYQLQVATDAKFTNLVIDEKIDGVSNSMYKVQAGDLLKNKSYYWRVRSFNTDGQFSVWSSVWRFITAY
jgi:subtilisin family serine protease